MISQIVLLIVPMDPEHGHLCKFSSVDEFQYRVEIILAFIVRRHRSIFIAIGEFLQSREKYEDERNRIGWNVVI